MAAFAAIAAAVIGVIGTAVSIDANQDAAEEQRKVQDASNFEKRQNTLRQRIRERRILEGRIRNAAAQQGTSGSSGESGALSSLSSQFATGYSADSFSQAASERLGQIESDRLSGMATGSFISSAGQLVGGYASYRAKSPATTTTSQKSPLGPPNI